MKIDSGQIPTEDCKRADYGVVNLTKEEFDKLPEYSEATPTPNSKGVVVQRWKTRVPKDAKDKDATWFIGEVKCFLVVFSRITFVTDPK